MKATTTNNVGFTKVELIKMATEGKICRVFESESEALSYIHDSVPVDKTTEHGDIIVYEGTIGNAYKERVALLLHSVITSDDCVMWEVLQIYTSREAHNAWLDRYIREVDEDDVDRAKQFLYCRNPITYEGTDYYYTSIDTIITETEAEYYMDVVEALAADDENFDYNFEEYTEIYDAHNGNSPTLDEETALILTYMFEAGMNDEEDYHAFCNKGYEAVTQDVTRRWGDDYVAPFCRVTACSEELADYVEQNYYREAILA